jgi:two-component system, NarL family, response regulator
MKKARCIRIVIADDHSVLREGLASVINREPDMEVVAKARDWPDAIKQVLENRPEIAVLDLHMGGTNPTAGVTALQEKAPTVQIIIFSAFGAEEEVFQAIRAGARGYVLKGESGRDDLLVSIRAVSRGEIWIHPAAAARLAERMTAPTLTSREIEILQLMALGKSNKEIGASLDVTEGTVKVHVNHILAKLGVTGRVEAIRVAAQRGFVRLLEGSQEFASDLTNKQEQSPTDPHRLGGNISKAIGASNSTSQLPRKE